VEGLKNMNLYHLSQSEVSDCVVVSESEDKARQILSDNFFCSWSELIIIKLIGIASNHYNEGDIIFAYFYQDKNLVPWKD
jgi:hypothetical protein